MLSPNVIADACAEPSAVEKQMILPVLPAAAGVPTAGGKISGRLAIDAPTARVAAWGRSPSGTKDSIIPSGDFTTPSKKGAAGFPAIAGRGKMSAALTCSTLSSRSTSNAQG